MPPSLALIFRHRLERVWGDVFTTFFTCTHWVAMPRRVSPTRFTSARDENGSSEQKRFLQHTLLCCSTITYSVCVHLNAKLRSSYRRLVFSQAGWQQSAADQRMTSWGVWTWAPHCQRLGHIYKNTAGLEWASQHPWRSFEAGPWSSYWKALNAHQETSSLTINRPRLKKKLRINNMIIPTVGCNIRE